MRRGPLVVAAVALFGLVFVAGFAAWQFQRATGLRDDLAATRVELVAAQREQAETGEELAAAQQELTTASSTLAATEQELASAKQRLADIDAERARQAALTQTVTVKFSFRGGPVGSPCTATGGYSDIAAGTPVRVTSDSGKIVGTGTLGNGTASGGECLFVITMPGVQIGDTRILSAEVGRRGQISSTVTELRARGWTFFISLG